ncbi:MAG: hypothetical protein IKY17_04420 [Oscillospiraceae bacterium]|nr:hypothetical protein [Oscillospiraceae bacterium]
MVDIHCHILPCFDDGSPGMAESLEMARMAARTGVTDIVATPHFAGRNAAEDVLPVLAERCRELSRTVDLAGIPVKIHPGAEILCTAEMAELAKKKLLPAIGSTDYLLTEFYFDEDLRFMDEMLCRLRRAGYIPVVAHPERYDAIQRDPLILERWFRRGDVIQLNKGSILGALGHRAEHAAHLILDAGLAHIVASDAHSPLHRTPHMGELNRWMDRHLQPDYARILLEDNPRRLIRGEEMVPAD